MNTLYHQLILVATRPADPLTRAFAGAMEASRGILPAERPMGLDPSTFMALLQRYFPSLCVWPERDAAQKAAAQPSQRSDEYEDLARLLLDHRSDDRDETAWLASAMAAACLGNNHLWQDLGLANRQELSDLLQNHFASLYAKNTGNMKWKKFFYKQLCERAEVNACRAPSCRVCTDYAKCFGPEDGAAH